MANRNIGSLAIIGGGLAGWMSAAFLADVLGRSVSITLVESGDEPVGCGVATLPIFRTFVQRLGLSEQHLLADCRGTIRLGTQFVNWGTLGNRYFSPLGQYGADFDIVAIHHWWLKERSEFGDHGPIDALSLAAALAAEAKFTQPVADRRMLQSTFDYAYHIDPSLFIGLLKKHAEANGVQVVQGELGQVGRDTQTGRVTHVLLDQNAKVEADFFIDCTGSEGSLIKHASEAQFDDWSAYLPCNKNISLACAKGGELSPYTRATQRQAGWQSRIPLQHQIAHAHIYSDSHTSDEDALALLMENLDGRKVTDVTTTAFKSGARKAMMVDNVVAIGTAAGVLEPLVGTDVHLIQTALYRLTSLWPSMDFDTSNAGLFNKQMRSEYEAARDLIVLHYQQTTRADGQLWQYCKEMAIPESLQTRRSLWSKFGRLWAPSAEVFQTSAWLAAYLGQGLFPARWDPITDARADRVDFHANLSGLRRVVADTAAQSEDHESWIGRNLGSR